jgi:hypothetical protein
MRTTKRYCSAAGVVIHVFDVRCTSCCVGCSAGIMLPWLQWSGLFGAVCIWATEHCAIQPSGIVVQLTGGAWPSYCIMCCSTLADFAEHAETPYPCMQRLRTHALWPAMWFVPRLQQAVRSLLVRLRQCFAKQATAYCSLCTRVNAAVGASRDMPCACSRQVEIYMVYMLEPVASIVVS